MKFIHLQTHSLQPVARRSMATTIFTGILLLLMTGLTACRKFVDIPLPDQLIESENVFNTDKTAISAVSGLYSQMSAGTTLAGSAISIYMSHASDEVYNTAATSSYDPFTHNSLVSTNTSILTLWNSYKTIYHVNSTLEGLNNSTGLTDSVRRQLTGEVLFVRAFHYFYLQNLFGHIPLVTSTDYRVNSSLAATPPDTVHQQIIEDLNQSIALLSETYPAVNRARVNKWTAKALLARVYLYENNWEKAEQQSADVLNSGVYHLTRPLTDVFLINSPETIWQLARDNGNTNAGMTFLPSSETILPVSVFTPSFLESFEANDQRRDNWISTNIVNNIPYAFPNKYKARLSTPITEFDVAIRLAEVYLIHAEAGAHLNHLSQAVSDMDSIRVRAGLAPTTANSQDDILQAIATERQHELFTERGHRWFDLKRMNQLTAVLLPIKGSADWQVSDTILPIPETELNRNPFLHQNPGY